MESGEIWQCFDLIRIILKSSWKDGLVKWWVNFLTDLFVIHRKLRKIGNETLHNQEQIVSASLVFLFFFNQLPYIFMPSLSFNIPSLQYLVPELKPLLINSSWAYKALQNYFGPFGWHHSSNQIFLGSSAINLHS